MLNFKLLGVRVLIHKTDRDVAGKSVWNVYAPIRSYLQGPALTAICPSEEPAACGSPSMCALDFTRSNTAEVTIFQTTDAGLAPERVQRLIPGTMGRDGIYYFNSHHLTVLVQPPLREKYGH